ncbi:TonB-dependent siderophore receptor [Novosphingobium sp. 9]|uniref:TonB-dependent siderophore receptor n=1 Tax=Novosphingobium sp. 9 TaxID=2025349 RepID=UPI0021B67393|nr:TonB-dependent receptor plug domain-containing protein [Novosphingobium sp. 9]
MLFSKTRLALSGAVLLPAFGATLPALAQTEPQDTSAENILVLGAKDRTTLTTPNGTGSRLNLTPLQTPASIAVLDGDTVRARGDMSIAEAESRAPGITSVANLGNGGTALAARGFSGQGSVLQLVDGVRLYPGAGTITFPTDPWMVQQIDVLSGPASVLYGQAALGGAVNVVMRAPDAQKTEGQAEIGYGSQNTFHAAAGIGGPLADQLSYRVDASYRRSDGYVDRGGSHSLALSGALRWAPSDRLTVTLRDDWGDNHPSKYFGTPLIDGKLDTAIRHRNYNVDDASVWFHDNRTTLRVDWHPSNTLTFSNTAYRLTTKRHWQDLESYCWVGADGFCPNGYNAQAATPGTIYRTDNFGIDHDQTQWGDQGSMTLQTPLTAGLSNTLVTGFDVNTIGFTHGNDFGSDVQVSEVDPYAFDPGQFLDTQGIAPRYRTRTNEYAIFAEDRLALVSISQWSAACAMNTIR